MVRSKLFHRDSLGWLIPVLLFFVFYGIFLILNETGLLRELGLLFFIVSVVGLAFSRRVRRLIAYHVRTKTPERREAYAQETMMQTAKRLAHKENVPELITNLYFDYIVHLPGAIHAERSREAVIIPPVITEAKNLPGNRIMIKLSGKQYYFTFVQYLYSTVEGERNTQATLQVASDSQKLILLHLIPQVQGAPERFYPLSIESVVMGDWVNEFRHLQEVIHEERERQRHEDQMN